MCGRFFTIGDFKDKLTRLLLAEGISEPEDLYAAEGQDVFPSNASTVICGKQSRLTAAEMYWGFTSPYRSRLIINARAETAGEKPMFAGSMRRRRCVIPASGFYEWDAFKARFRFTAEDGGLLLLAGCYREEQGQNHYTILTTEANESMRPVHDRMPVLIGRGEVRDWILDDSGTTGFLERPQPQLLREQDEGQIRLDLGF